MSVVGQWLLCASSRRLNAKDAFLVVGLGNPGQKYKKSRHNAGFNVIDILLKAYQPHSQKSRGRALVAQVDEGGVKLILAKPQTFMNLSGESVRDLARIFSIPPERLLVVYDDIDLPPGALRLRARGSAGTHNGMRSIISCLNTQEFPRLRVGVGKPPPEWDLADYVLAPFPLSEREMMEETFSRAADAVRLVLADGVEKTMSRVNG